MENWRNGSRNSLQFYINNSMEDIMLLCKHCGKECKNKNSLINHERLCKQNPERQTSSFVKYNETRETPVPWNKGKTAHDDFRIKERAAKQQKTMKEKSSRGELGTPHTDEFKIEQRERKLAMYASGWEPTCGRCKKYDYESPIAGKIKVDGTWELKVARHLDSIGVNWIRNKKRFKYNNLKGGISTYQPDFFVYEWNSYLEVKGYETDLDRCKWSQFNDNLIIWREKEIKLLEG
jgi:hypothetical protein